ncbi:uncharacterized protein BKA55DRAFT_538698 [Fusarium redolens]|uniref:Uncharacterized protein n=1 Tax=Fusarium redolens TaxID=48865 RepID=A0A9P9K922_FUSRE|nr:uncharacterized protein BKA55DRAFT_538698 [Fusarium redolens]KAH7253842.1 hypothetical protein BKA55DRAFT_538698 [Fusarium redolens]
MLQDQGNRGKEYCDLTARGDIIELGPEVRQQNAHGSGGPKLIRQRGCPGWTEVHLGLSGVGHTGIRAALGSLYSLLETLTKVSEDLDSPPRRMAEVVTGHPPVKNTGGIREDPPPTYESRESVVNGRRHKRIPVPGHDSGGPLKGYRTLGKSLDSTKKKKRKEEIQARRHLEIPSFSPNEDN